MEMSTWPALSAAACLNLQGQEAYRGNRSMQMRTVGQQQGVSSAVDGRLPLKLQSQVSVIVMDTASMCWPCSAAMRAHQE